jgi:hypothetical protein
MSGRRSHSRFTITPASDGVLRILYDVVVQEWAATELIAISREPGIVGEVIALQIVDSRGTMDTAARVTESRPLIADGAVRHRLRLERVQSREIGI